MVQLLTKKEIQRLLELQQYNELSAETLSEMMLLLSKASPHSNKAIDDLLFENPNIVKQVDMIALGVLIGYGLGQVMRGHKND